MFQFIFSQINLLHLTNLCSNYQDRIFLKSILAFMKKTGL